MKWELKYQRDGWSIQSGKAKGRAIPQWYLDEPQIDDLDLWFMEAFWDLTTTRSFGQVPGPISWSSIQFWASVHLLDSKTTSTLHWVIREMDNVYLDWMFKELKNG